MRPFLYLLLLLLATGCTLPFSSKSTLEQTGKCRELTHLGVSSMEAGRIDEAIVHLKAAKKVYPYDVEARRQLGEALWRKGDAQGAIKELQEAVKLRKEGADITRVAEMFLTIRQFQLAKEAALDAIDVEPENGKAWAVKA